MRNPLKYVVSIALAAGMATAAYAHAFLDRAVPGVGATVNGAPSELQLVFSQNLVPAFSSVSIASESGEKIPVGKPAPDAANPSVLRVRLGRALKPGTYVVNWRVVSIDTHPTSGTYRFTVAP